MVLSDSVYEIAEKFMSTPTFVSINFEALDEVATQMKLGNPPQFPINHQEENIFKMILLELVGDAINYCYWYGRGDVRPGGASSSLMYANLKNAFFNYSPADRFSFRKSIESFIENLKFARFPMLEERIKHLYELLPYAEDYVQSIIDSDRKNITPHFNNLISHFPGYASDIFLKRASLFFIQLYRYFSWFKDAMSSLHIPADYQVPKVMNHEGLIEYNTELSYDINSNRQILKGSLKECEIRSATIHIAKLLGEMTDWNVAQIDGYFWLKRKETSKPFHLCITTDY